ncbi:MAG: CHAT domain-containing protein [Cyanobacteria bacterium P01_G01_bin.54]
MAQTITPASDGTGTIVLQQGSDRFEIQGGSLSGDGQNLFHSFEQFGLDTGQIADFLTQPQIQNVLGRVMGGDPSLINGLLQVSGSNANLYLMNPAGIVFGPDASLNVGGDFFTTTADGIGLGSDGWFNATGSNDYAALVGEPHTFAFEAIAPGAIVNAGALATPGNLTLLAGEVVNTGALSANTVTVYAMPESGMVRISQPDHLLSLEVLPPRDRQGNVGAIAPLDLPTLLTGSPVNLDTEVITALDPGTTWAAGTITANEVNLLGEQVAILETITTPTHGSVRIGGDYLGGGTIPNAKRTYVAPQATIAADQGRVIIWSDEVTRFFGTVNAPGGFVETSSKDYLEVIGSSVIATDWLLDPRNVTIGTFTSGTFATSGVNPIIFEATSDDAIIDVTTITGALAGGVSIAINTGVTGTQAGNITVATPINPINVNGGLTLTLDAANDIIINAPIINGDTTESHFLNVELFAGGNIDINGAITTRGGKIEAQSTGGNIDASGVTLSTADTGVAFLNAQGGNVTLTANGTITTGAIDASATHTAGSSAIAGTVTLSATSNTPIRTAQQIAGGSLITTEAGGAITTTTINASATATGGGNGTGGAVTLTAVGSASTGAIDVSAIGLTATNGTVTVNQTPATTVFVPDEILDEQSEDCIGEGCNPAFDDAPEHRALRHGDAPMPMAYCRGDTQRAIAVAEDHYSQELGSYLNLGRFPATLSGAQTQQVLQTVARTSGQATAIVYMGFCTPSQTTALDAERTPSHHPKQTVSEPGSASESANVPDRDRLVLVVGRPEGEPLRYEINVSRRQLQDVSRRFRRSVANPSRRTAYLEPAQQLYDWILKPLEADLQAAGIDHLAYVPVPGLRTIPLAALHDGNDFAIARYSLSLLPSLSLTNPTPVSLHNQTVLAMGAATFTEQPSLPAVPVELAAITEQLWQGEAYLNEAFTYQRLNQARQATPHGIIHLATHAAFRPGQPQQSYIQLWDRRLALPAVQRLDWRSPLVELLILSACDTALGDPDAELGFTGLAVSTGAKSAVGSLWIVSDLGTLALMAQFYGQLQTADRAQALQQAQLAMSRGQVTIQDTQLRLAPTGTGSNAVALPPELLRFAPTDFSHPFYWAAFTLVGSPW